jgi:hypothetical protein
MNISEIFNLSKSQFELDFVNIDPTRDTPLFLDPHLIGLGQDAWTEHAAEKIRSFFQRVVTLLRTGDIETARAIFSHLGEPNETCLGMSKGSPQGRGPGKTDAARIFAKMSTSRAVLTGLVDDLEDSAIFVDGIGPDKLSDITTNILRGMLIEYTQMQCGFWGIPLRSGVASGPIWNSDTLQWEQKHTEMLIVKGKKILLVPKGIVAWNSLYTPYQYYQFDILCFLQQEQLRLGTSLVRKLRKKKGAEELLPPYKKTLTEKGLAVFNREFLASFTTEHPEVFANFKDRIAKLAAAWTPFNEEEMHLGEVISALQAQYTTISPGTQGATKYHRLTAGALELLAYPNLRTPTIEKPLYGGRKRVDISFPNAALSGFFIELVQIHQVPCRIVFVECKNYSDDLANPEIDQLLGRFSVNSGKFGIVTCRTVENRLLLLNRCADIWKAQQSAIIVMADQDIIEVLEARRTNPEAISNFLRARFSELITT